MIQLRRRIAAFAAPLLVAALAACATDRGAETAELALACQVRPCICEPESRPLFTPRDDHEVLWRDDGTPYCPPDHRLRRVAPASPWR